jgi:hypothetical protein
MVQGTEGRKSKRDGRVSWRVNAKKKIKRM